MIPADMLAAAAEAGIRAWFVARSYTPDPSASLDRLLVLAHSVRVRTLPTQKWTVHWTRDLRESHAYAINRHAVNAVVEKAERGLPLYAHQSTSLDDIDANDGLLTDWGVQHLHLETAPHAKKPKYVKRADYVLFVYPVVEHLILLDIVRHPHGEEWSDDRPINLLHRDYPKVIECHRAWGITNIETPITRAGRHNLRKNGAVVYTQVSDGTVYFPPGGGPATNTRPWIVRKAADMTMWLLRPENVRHSILAENPKVPDEPPVSMSVTFEDDLRVRLSASWRTTKVDLPEWPRRSTPVEP